MRDLTLKTISEIRNRQLDQVASIYESTTSGDFVIVNAGESNCSTVNFDTANSVPASCAPDLSAIFRSKAAETGATLSILYLRNAIVFPRHGLVITEEGALIADSCTALFSENMALIERLNTVPGINYADSRITLENEPDRICNGKSLFASHAGSGVFGHWYFDTLPAIVSSLSDVRKYEGRIIFSELTAWQKETLAVLGADGIASEVGDGPVLVSELLLSSYIDVSNTRASSTLMNDVFAAMRDRQGENGCSPARDAKSKRLYITRRNVGSRRRMINEMELCRQLSSVGFDVIAPEELTIQDQIDRFSNAEVVVAPAGSANVNVGFMKPGSKFVEIFSGEYYDFAFARLALNAGLNYSYFQTNSMAEDFALYAWHGFHAGHQYYSYSVDVKQLLEMITDQLEVSQVPKSAEVLHESRLTISDVVDQKIYFRLSAHYERLPVLGARLQCSAKDRDIYVALNDTEESILVHPKTRSGEEALYTRAEYIFDSKRPFIWAGSVIWSPHPLGRRARFTLRVRNAGNGELIASTFKELSGGEISFLGARFLEECSSVLVELETETADLAGETDYAWCKFVRPSLYQ